MRDQRIRDPVHNLIKFLGGSSDDQVLWQLVQSSPLQRLRRVKQLGFSELVYPGAGHSRFSHSLGAMQMARRMLEAFEKNSVISADKEWSSATLCAALLHDVGHGPFSHVFEEVSSELGISVHHEKYTELIIQSDEISKIIGGPGTTLFDHTLSFFQTEPGQNQYSRIVSSQLDADRLDFLVRDRFFTGVQFGMIDLEWLFDSLTIQELPDINGEVTEFTMVSAAKGAQVVEEYLSAYAHMYSNVYFHKTTRAAQFMVQKILLDLFADESQLKKLPQNDPIKSYFEAAPNPDINLYLQLDDTSVISLLKLLTTDDFGALTELAKRFFQRDLFKCFEVPKPPGGDPPRKKIGKFQEAMDSKDIEYQRDVVSGKGYKQFDIVDGNFLQNILVEDDGEPRPIGELRPSVKHLAQGPVVRYYFDNADERSTAVEIWNSI